MMTPGQYEELTKQVDKLIEVFSMQEAAEKHEVAAAVRAYVDQDLVDALRGQHQHDYEWYRHCGANVCNTCGDHQGLARCYCGWSLSGGNGARELIEMGENIEED